MNSVQRLQGGRSNTCVKWVGFWRLNWTTLRTQYSEVTSNGLRDSSSASLLCVERVTLKGNPSSFLPSNLAVWKSRSCLDRRLLPKGCGSHFVQPLFSRDETAVSRNCCEIELQSNNPVV